MTNINLVLSGGGARGIAHLGVIKALQEYDFNIQKISGVSSGAIAGAFIAKGMSPDEVLEMINENSHFNPRPSRFNMGLFSKNNMLNLLEKYFPTRLFNGLHIPLFVSATNINYARTDCFSKGDLVKTLMASSALPILFSPVEINGYQYLDGGLLNNLPVEPFLEDDVMRVGVHVNPLNKTTQISSVFKIIERSIELAVFKTIRVQKRYVDLFLEPSLLKGFPTYDFSKSKELFKIGYEYSKRRLDKFLNGGRKRVKLNKAA